MKDTNYKSKFMKKASYLLIVVLLFSMFPMNANATSAISEPIKEAIKMELPNLSINMVTPNSTYISGTAKDASSVNIFIDDTFLGNFKVAEDGSFKTTPQSSIKENGTIKVISKSSLGFPMETKTILISNLSAPKIISLSKEESFYITIGGDPNMGYIVGQADPHCIIDFNFLFNNEVKYSSTTTSDEEGLFYITYDFWGNCDAKITSRDPENTQSKTLTLTSDEWEKLTHNRSNYIFTDEISFGTPRDNTGLTSNEIAALGYTITAYDEENNILAERIGKPNDGLYAFDGIEYMDLCQMPLAAPRNSIVRIVLTTKNQVKYDKTGIWPDDFDYDLLYNGIRLMYPDEPRLLKYNMIKQWSKYFFVNKLYNNENISYEDWLNQEESLIPLPISMELEYPKALTLEDSLYSPNPFEIKLNVHNTSGNYFEKMSFSFDIPDELTLLNPNLINQELSDVYPGETREISLEVKLNEDYISKFDKNITFYATPNIEEFSSGFDTFPISGSIFIPGNPDSKIDDEYEPDNNVPQNAINLDKLEFNSKISYSGDVDWWKVDVISPVTLRVLLDCPKNTNYNLELYDSYLNKIAFDISNYDQKVVTHTIKDNAVSKNNPKTFYIKVLGNTDKDFNTKNTYHLYVEGIAQEGGSEFLGWDYIGYKYPVSSSPLRLYFDKSCKKLFSSKYETYAGESIKSIVEQGIATWNYEDTANNKPTTIIEIDENNSTGTAFPIKVVNKSYISSQLKPLGATAYYLPKTYDSSYNITDLEVLINDQDFSKYDASNVNKLKSIITHELGHALGFKDMYANDVKKYGVDNRDKMMYGNSDFTHNGEIHPIEKSALSIIQGWKPGLCPLSYGGETKTYLSASSPYFDNTSLHAEAKLIVKGTVMSTENIYEEDSIPQTKLQFKVDKYYKDLTKDFKDIINVYQDGNTDYPMSDNTLLKDGDEVILYLGSNSPNEYYILGGPQGMYNLTLEGSTSYVLSEIDKQLYNDLSSNGYDVSNIVPVELSSFEEEVENTLSNLPPDISDSEDEDTSVPDKEPSVPDKDPSLSDKDPSTPDKDSSNPDTNITDTTKPSNPTVNNPSSSSDDVIDSADNSNRADGNSEGSSSYNTENPNGTTENSAKDPSNSTKDNTEDKNDNLSNTNSSSNEKIYPVYPLILVIFAVLVSSTYIKMKN